MGKNTAASRPGLADGGALLSAADIDLDELTRDREFNPSPDAWEDQILYFLLADRFSDGRETEYRGNDGKYVRVEGGTPRFAPSKDTDNAVKNEQDAARWREAGDAFVGGNLKGIASKLGYIKRLGATAVWISPVFKQAAWAPHDYHGYGIQNFLEIDPHFGTREDLRDLVRQAHEIGLYVVLDVVVNHCCDAFGYGEPGQDGEIGDARWNGHPYPVKGFRDRTGQPSLPFEPLPDGADTESAVWPRELQRPECFHRLGPMVSWENCPEYVDGDFFGLKDFDLGEGEGDDFRPSAALEVLTKCYQYWMAYADVDGFRIDTVKHMGVSAARHFAREIHGFAERIGKRKFYLIAEIGGGNANSYDLLWRTEVDAALAIDEVPNVIRDVVTGRRPAEEYFAYFRNHLKDGDYGEPTWLRGSLVTFFDDHDQVSRPVKGRFASEFGGDRRAAERAILRAVALNVFCLGIPCLYYGSEQALDGHALDPAAGNRYVRETLFGGEFGPFRSRGRHAFNENTWLYKEIGKLAELRRVKSALRRGRQYLRPVSEDGETFTLPGEAREGDAPYRGIVAWSRLLDVDDMLCVLNTDDEKPRSVWVTADYERHPPGGRPLRCFYSTDPEQVGTECCPPEARNGSAVCLTVPAGGFAIFL
jgi:glycosidase